MTIDKNFRYIIDSFGAPEGIQSLSREEIMSYEGNIPENLLEFWLEYGLGTVLEGYFQFCNPSKYSDVIEVLLGDDPQFGKQPTHLIGFSAFGKLIAWNSEYQDLKIDLVNMDMRCIKMFEASPTAANIAISSSLMGINDRAMDEYDSAGKTLFKRAKAKLGKLSPNHVYGFSPLLAFGGDRSLDSLSVKSAPEHLLIMAQAASLRLLDTSNFPPRFVRNVG